MAIANEHIKQITLKPRSRMSSPFSIDGDDITKEFLWKYKKWQNRSLWNQQEAQNKGKPQNGMGGYGRKA